MKWVFGRYQRSALMPHPIPGSALEHWGWTTLWSGPQQLKGWKGLVPQTLSFSKKGNIWKVVCNSKKRALSGQESYLFWTQSGLGRCLLRSLTPPFSLDLCCWRDTGTPTESQVQRGWERGVPERMRVSEEPGVWLIWCFVHCPLLWAMHTQRVTPALQPPGHENTVFSFVIKLLCEKGKGMDLFLIQWDFP